MGPFYRSGDAVREVLRSPWLLGLLPALGGFVLLARRSATRWIAVYGAVAVVGYLALLSFVAPGLLDTPRYLVPLVPLVVCGGACLLASVPGPVLRPLALAAGVVAIGLSAADELRYRVDGMRSFDIYKSEVFSRDVTNRLNRIASRGDTVLSYEVQLRYFLRGDVRVLSEDGITDGKVSPYQDRHDMTGFLLRYRPRWWIADQNVLTRPYLRGSVLERAFVDYRGGSGPASRTLDGIGFQLIARRTRPLGRGFGGWQMLFRLDYPGGSSSQ